MNGMCDGCSFVVKADQFNLYFFAGLRILRNDNLP